jgi:hypothetical protein
MRERSNCTPTSGFRTLARRDTGSTSLVGDTLTKPDTIKSDITTGARSSEHKAESEHKAHRLKEKAVEEFKLYWIVAIFLAVMFGAFTTYRRLVLGEMGVSYGHFGAGLIQALIIAKVILIGDAMKLGRGMEKYPLIYSVLVKSVLFSLFVGVFNILEHAIEGWWHGETWSTILAHPFEARTPDEFLARSIVLFVTFIPFFALWETGRVLGHGRLAAMFLHRQTA